MQIHLVVIAPLAIPEDAPGLDIDASLERYASLWRDAVASAYPDASVTVEISADYVSQPIVIKGDAEIRDDLIREHIADIDGRLWWDFDLWTVYR